MLASIRRAYYAAPMQRAILHVDMDAFYASVEQRDDPRLRGKPVAVGGASRRGVTRSQALLGLPRQQAEAIKSRIRERTSLTASVGIAEVKFAAKIASDLCKPDGLLEVPVGQVREFLAPLPASRLWGVGPRTDEILKAAGLRIIGDVARADPAFLEARLGSIGPWLHDLANGTDDR